MPVTPLENEAELLAKVAKGEHLAFKLLYELYHDKIFKFAFKIMGTREASEEILQETMLYIWQQGYKLKNIPNFEAYLKRIAKHKAIDTFRKQALAQKIQEVIFAEYEDSYQIAEDDNLLAASRKLLEDGIGQLPPQQREVYQLAYRQGMKYEQIAEQLNISHGTVQTHMKLALKFLRGYIKNHPDMLVLIVIFRLFEK